MIENIVFIYLIVRLQNNIIMKTRIFNLIILDESGSMFRVMNQAIDGVNETIQSIRAAQKTNDNQEHFVTIVTFNDEVNTIHNIVPVDNVSDLTENDYRPNGCTALYDAIGTSLTELMKNVSEADRVLVTIVTDGMENSSKEYDGHTIKSMIEQLKKKSWIFTYIGANHNVEEVAESISITNNMVFEATESGTSRMFRKELLCRQDLYSRMCNEDFDADEENMNFFRKK